MATKQDSLGKVAVDLKALEARCHRLGLYSTERELARACMALSAEGRAILTLARRRKRRAKT